VDICDPVVLDVGVPGVIVCTDASGSARAGGGAGSFMVVCVAASAHVPVGGEGVWVTALLTWFCGGGGLSAKWACYAMGSSHPWAISVRIWCWSLNLTSVQCCRYVICHGPMPCRRGFHESGEAEEPR